MNLQIIFLLLLSFQFVFAEEDIDHITDLQVDGVPCQSREIVISFTGYGGSHSISLFYNPEIFHESYDHSQHDEICPYSGPHGSAVFLAGQLHKLYLDAVDSLSEAHELEQSVHFFNRRQDDYHTADEPAHVAERRVRILAHEGPSFVILRSASVQREDIYCGNHDEHHEPHHEPQLDRHTQQLRIDPLPGFPAAGQQSTYPSLSASAVYKVPAPSPCPSSSAQKQITVAIAADTTFYNIFGSTSAANAEIVALVQWMSATYGNTVNIKMSLAASVVRTAFDSSSSAFTWNTGDCASQTTSTMLDRFTNWRLTQANYGIWHLLTKCWSTGNVGLAWTGVACTQGAPLNGAGPGRFSNTGVSSYVPGTGHMIATHEIGHNFGAGHDDTNKGLMVSCFCGSTSNFQDFSFASQSAICSASGAASCLTAASSSTTTAATTTTTAATTTTKATTTTTKATTTTTKATTTTTKATTTTTKATSTTTKAASSTTTTKAASTTTTTTTKAPSTTTTPTTTKATTTTTTTKAATTTTTTTTSNINAQIISALNTLRANHGVPSLVYSPGAASFAASYTSKCTYPQTVSVNTTYGAFSYFSSPQSTTNPLTAFNGIISNGQSGYVCSSDTCSNTYCSGAYRNWIAKSVTGFACVTTHCAVGTASPWGTTTAWDYTMCVPTPYAVYSGQTPQVVCPASNNKRSADECAALCDGRNCGEVSAEGCPTQTCGSGACDPRATCSAEGQCVCESVTTCESRKITCGTIVDNCGNTLVCDSDCSQPCVPQQADAVCGDSVCGTAADGCGGVVQCGGCLESAVCSAGQCLECPQCHALATCVADGAAAACQCNAGFTGDGMVCAAAGPAFSNPDRCSGLSWSGYKGHSDRFFLASAMVEGEQDDACAINHVAGSSSSWDSVIFKAYTYDRDGGDVLFAAEILRASGSVGLLAGATHSGDYYRFYWDDSDATFYFQSSSKHQHRNARQAVLQAGWPADSAKTLSIVARADGTVAVSVDGSAFKAFDVTHGKPAKTSYFGLTASGDASAQYAGLLFSSSAQLAMEAWGCWTAPELVDMFSAMLGLDPAYLSVTVTCGASTSAITVVISDGQQGTRKRAAAAVINPASYVSLLDGWLSSGAAMQGSIAAVAPSIAAAAPVTSVAGAAPASGGLSGGEIAGIVVGSVVGGVLLIGGAAYLVVASSKSDSHSAPANNSSAPAARPKSWRASLWRSHVPKDGINIESGFEDRAAKHKSITARNQEGYA